MTTLGQESVDYSSGGWQQVVFPTGSDNYALNAWTGDIHRYGYAKSTNSGATATYRAQINVSGNYMISEWHPNVADDGQGSACGNVGYNTSWGDSGSINQGSNSGRWNQITSGPVYLGTGVSTVTLTAPGVCATASDAIRWEYIN